MKDEQLRLYKHFVNLSLNGNTDLQKINAKGYAEQILLSFPEFKAKPVEVKPVAKKEIKNGK